MREVAAVASRGSALPPNALVRSATSLSALGAMRSPFGKDEIVTVIPRVPEVAGGLPLVLFQPEIGERRQAAAGDEGAAVAHAGQVIINIIHAAAVEVALLALEHQQGRLLGENPGGPLE